MAWFVAMLAACTLGGTTLWHSPTPEEREQQRREQEQRDADRAEREDAQRKVAVLRSQEELLLDRMAPNVLLAHTLGDVQGCERLRQVRGFSRSEMNAPPRERPNRELYREEYFFTARRDAARQGGNRMLRVTDALYDVYRCP